ncbi:MAG: energy transducer TonB, partial [Terriglobales bacterium]
PPPAPAPVRAPVPLPLPEPKVEVSRFGAPAGLAPHPGVPVPVPELGSFGPSRTAPVTAAPAGEVQLGASGFNRPASGGGGSSSFSGGVRAAGFPGAASGPAAGSGPAGAVSLNHFAGARPVLVAEIPSAPPAAADFVPPEVLAWPAPVYTTEAAAHRIEGEVRLEARLRADGTVEVLRVLNRLGFGLDASAAAAARQLKFRPARRHGQLVDWTVVLHIDFRLAY